MVLTRTLHEPVYGSEPQQIACVNRHPAKTIELYIKDLQDPRKRQEALEDLSYHRLLFPNIGQQLWNKEGIITLLLQVIISIYPLLPEPDRISRDECNRVCNAMALMQTVAVDPVTRESFIQTHIPLYLYPLLNTTQDSRSHEYLRLSSLGIIGALVRSDSPKIVSFLINTEMIPICLTVLEHGGEMSLTVATFVLQKVLEQNDGLLYMTGGIERRSTVLMVLGNLVQKTLRYSSARLFKHLLRCYIRIVDHKPTRDMLRERFPLTLMDHTFSNLAQRDFAVVKWLERLLMKMNIPSPCCPPLWPTSPVSQAANPNNPTFGAHVSFDEATMATIFKLMQQGNA